MSHFSKFQCALAAKWPAGLVWAAAWVLMQALESGADLANLALLLVLAAAVAGLWLNVVESVGACALAVLAFNWAFVPPRGTFSVDLRQHAWLLLATLGVGSVVAALMARQRRMAEKAQALADQAQLLRDFNERIVTASPQQTAQWLAQTLTPWVAGTVAVALLDTSADSHFPQSPQIVEGTTSPEEMAYLHECLRSHHPLAVGNWEVHGQHTVALALWGSDAAHGAVLVRAAPGVMLPATTLATVQALCHQTGLHLERLHADEQARQARDQAAQQQLRNTLLAAISHDYRTPLATLIGAATSLQQQSDRLSSTQSQALIAGIISQAQHLSHITDNTLQLARLGHTQVQIRKDWESLDELIASAVARTRHSFAQLRVALRIEAGLPLLRCDAQLVVQLLGNLIDNAIKYGDGSQTVEVVVRRLEGQLLVSVADRGPGIPMAMRERVFLPFERGQSSVSADANRPGVGLGLALCKAIADAHGATLVARPRTRGGTAMECRFPIEAQPPGEATTQPEPI